MALDTVPLAAMTSIGGDGLLGGRLGSYRLLEAVAAGAYATVYRVVHEVMGVERAVKVLRTPAARSPEQQDRFLREARLAARLRHPNVVSVFDCASAPDGTPYLVMEYVAGRSLAQRLRQGVPPASETLRIAGQVAAALDYAHSCGVVHRDVKPANVLLGDDGSVRLADFGIACLGSDGDRGQPYPGLGTPDYMAPEQRLAQTAGQGARTDVYGLAIVLFEMLTGRTPLGDGTAGAANSLTDPIPPPRSVNPYLPEAVDRSLASGLARDPGRRPATASALVGELAAALGDPPSLADDAAPRSRVAPDGDTAQPTSLPPLPREVPPPSGCEAPPSSRWWLVRFAHRGR